MNAGEMTKMHIKGVEVFSTGTWNGDAYTVADLDEMVRAYTETNAKVKPSVKLGHSDNQALLQKEGYPSAGWVTGLYRLGEKLLADLSDIPDKVGALIEKKAYRKVSSEVYWNINFEGTVYKRMLSAVALLGQEMPAVTTLSDILGLYASVAKADRVGAFAQADSAHTLKDVTLENSEYQEAAMPKTEAEIKLEQENEALKKFKADADKRDADAAKAKADLEKENAELKQFKIDADKRAAEAERLASEARLDQAVTDLQAAGLCSPAMKPYVRELLGAEKKEYAFKAADGAEKKLDRVTLVKEILKLHSQVDAVNFSDKTKREAEIKNSADKQADLESKVEKYAAENKVNYRTAYTAVLKAEKAKET
jgi:hypothetical protein